MAEAGVDAVAQKLLAARSQLPLTGNAAAVKEGATWAGLQSYPSKLALTDYLLRSVAASRVMRSSSSGSTLVLLRIQSCPCYLLAGVPTSEEVNPLGPIP